MFIDGVLASVSACEASHYTGDPEISARVCRYHILKNIVIATLAFVCWRNRLGGLR